MFTVTDEGAVRTLTLDNPARRNAIPSDGWPRLEQIFTEFTESDQRCLVVTGAGGSFCSGADLSPGEMDDRSIMANTERMRAVGRAATALHRIPKPTIAAVEGHAVGAGMNLALGCDIVIASRTAVFAELFVKRGLTVDFGGTWLLPRLVGLAAAKELALTGRTIEAEDAHSLGLVARLVEPSEVGEAAAALAAELAAGAPLAQELIKAALNRSLDMTFEEALAFEDQAQAVALASDDFVEGVQAFLDKRPPEFRGR